MAQVYAQQAQAAGINVNLRQIAVTEYYGPNYLKWVFAQDYFYSGPYLTLVEQTTLPKGPFNETHFDNPTYNNLFSQALATLDTAKRTEIAHEMQMIDYNEGGYIIPFFPSVIDGYAPNVNVTAAERDEGRQVSEMNRWTTSAKTSAASICGA